MYQIVDNNIHLLQGTENYEGYFVSGGSSLSYEEAGHDGSPCELYLRQLRNYTSGEISVVSSGDTSFTNMPEGIQSIEEITIYTNVLKVGLFSDYTKLQRIIFDNDMIYLGDGLTIPESAFQGCTGLERIDFGLENIGYNFLPKSDVCVEQYAFTKCYNLSEIYFHSHQSLVDKNDDVYIIEVNPRSSRTVPFLSKSTGYSLADIATEVILGKSLKEQGLTGEYSDKSAKCAAEGNKCEKNDLRHSFGDSAACRKFIKGKGSEAYKAHYCHYCYVGT